MAKVEDYVSVTEAVAMLEVAPNTVRAWGASGKLSEYRHPVNNYRLFKVSDLTRLKKRIENPPSGGARRSPK